MSSYKIEDVIDLRAFSLDYMVKKYFICKHNGFDYMQNALKPNDVLDLQNKLTGLLLWYFKNTNKLSYLDEGIQGYIDMKMRELYLFLETDLVVLDYYKPSNKSLGKDYRLNPIIFGYDNMGFMRDWVSVGELFTILKL